ncbi:MBL fold metallo-hydrolase [Patescibacteria group bacterium]|nr:MBL fold metallo-hydrolase [Patescibacteria group bacterium]
MKPDNIKIIFLGTNGWYDTKTGNTICTLLETKEYSIILDAGNGIYKIAQYIDVKKPAFLFLTHFHLDHIVGVHILTKFKFRQGLNIYGQKGTKKILNKLINQPFTVPLAKLRYKVKIQGISEGKYFLPFLVEAKFLVHSSPCLGYRFEIDGKKIAYCTDTGICQNFKELARGADLLITECTLKSGQKTPGWPHLTPEQGARIAKEAGVKKLILTHFDSGNYKTIKERKEAEKIAKTIFKNTTAAFDNLEINL